MGARRTRLAVVGSTALFFSLVFATFAHSVPRTLNPSVVELPTLFSATEAETTYFGNSDENGLAIPGDLWSFDHGGADPFEGWSAVDQSDTSTDYFRWMDATQWSDPQYPDPPVLAGMGSLWVGALDSEVAPLCWAGGAGYGDDWCLRAESPILTADQSQNIDLSFQYFNDTEFDFDFTRARVRKADGDEVPLAEFTGQFGLSPSHPFETPTGELFVGQVTLSDLGLGTEFRLVFEMTSDGSWSDEDGNYLTEYGAFGLDDVALSNGIVGGDVLYDFESGLDGWTVSSCGTGSFFGIEDVNVYFVEDPVGCQLSGNVIEFHDLNLEHPQGQLETAVSNPVDLLGSGIDVEQIVASWDAYRDLPIANAVFYRVSWQYYPNTCPATGYVTWSPTLDLPFYYTSEPTCSTGLLDGLNTGLPMDAEQVRLVLEIVSDCDLVAECSGVTNFTPVFDNLKIGVVTGCEFGACCWPNGTCLVATEELCTGTGGEYKGDGTDCDPHPCEQPAMGACCLLGECTFDNQWDCEVGGGDYEGDGTSCIPNPCPPTGACCLPDTCFVEAENRCEGLFFEGDFPCLFCPTTGACCNPDSTACFVATEEDCVASGSYYSGDEVPCDPTICDLVGACCLFFGECVLSTPFACKDPLGEYQGNGVSCNPDPCNTAGACCTEVGECYVQTEQICFFNDDDYQGDGTVCEPNPCPYPVIDITKAFTSYLPEAGNETTFTARIYYKDPITDECTYPGLPRNIQFTLSELSSERGTALNKGRHSHTDYHFNTAANQADFTQTASLLDSCDVQNDHHEHWTTVVTNSPVTEITVTVFSEDFAGYGMIQASAADCQPLQPREPSGAVNCNAGTAKVSIPRDENGNHISDGWAFDAVNGTDPDYDEEDWPNTDAIELGDGLTRYEEYRGVFRINQDNQNFHDRLAVSVKEVFVYRENPDWGVQNLGSVALEYFVTPDQMNGAVHDSTSGTIRPDKGPRIINFNGTSHHKVDQHAMWLAVGANPGGGGVGNWGLARDNTGGDNGPFGPIRFGGRVEVYLDNMRAALTPRVGPSFKHMKVWAFYDWDPSAIEDDIIKGVIGHELGHGVGLPHHRQESHYVLNAPQLDPTTFFSLTKKPVTFRRWWTSDEPQHDCVMRYDFRDMREMTSLRRHPSGRAYFSQDGDWTAFPTKVFEYGLGCRVLNGGNGSISCRSNIQIDDTD